MSIPPPSRGSPTTTLASASPRSPGSGSRNCSAKRNTARTAWPEVSSYARRWCSRSSSPTSPIPSSPRSFAASRTAPHPTAITFCSAIPTAAPSGSAHTFRASTLGRWTASSWPVASSKIQPSAGSGSSAFPTSSSTVTATRLTTRSSDPMTWSALASRPLISPPSATCASVTSRARPRSAPGCSAGADTWPRSASAGSAPIRASSSNRATRRRAARARPSGSSHSMIARLRSSPSPT